MKRLPFLLNVLAVALLAASCAYWALQLYKPAQRPLAATPPALRAEPSIAAATGLFGGAQAAAVSSNYQLTGVVAAGAESVAIIAANGAPAKAVRLGREVAPGVLVREIHARHVMLSENGVARRIDLAQDMKPAAAMNVPSVPAPPPVQPVPAPAAAPTQPAVAPPVEVPALNSVAPAQGLAPAAGQPQPPMPAPPPAFTPQGQPAVRMPPPVPATGVSADTNPR